jgi:hypothetical protein
MPYHRAAYLNHQDVRIDELVVHSYEMGGYLVEADYDGRRGFLVNNDNHPQRFQSVEQVKQSLSDCTVRQAWLVHQSAYDEMCGGPEKTDNTLKVPLWV